MAAAKKTVATKPDPKAKGKEVATKKDNLPAAQPAFDMSEYAGGGMENADRDSFAIPFLAIAQKMSPQVDKDDDRYLPDLEVGDLFLTTSQEIFKDEEGTDIVFCGFRRVFLRWAPRDQGGGFKGEMSVDDVAAGRSTGEFKEVEGKLFANNGDLIRDTRIHYVVVVREDGTFEAAVLSVASTQIKKSKMLLTQLNTYKEKGANGTYTPPSFAHIFHAETIAEQNDQGSWRGWKFTRQRGVDAAGAEADLFKFCVQFSESVRGGTVRVDHSANAEAAASASIGDGEGF
jgi:hypothetical protein